MTVGRAMPVSLFAAVVAVAPASSPLQTNGVVDGATIGVALVGTLLFSLIPVDTSSRWADEILPFDEGVKDNFSSRSAAVSDLLVTTTVALPVAVQLGRGLDRRLADNLLVYGESLGVSILLNGAVKYLVQRPRPYVYSEHPLVRAYAQDQGRDSHLSFYSGHSALSFTAAVSGAYLFSLGAAEGQAKAIVWGLELALATATANLRVRAGKHFYSDILLGALLGCAAGFGVPYLHAKRPGQYTPSAVEWAAMGGGVAVGAALSQLLPMARDVVLPLGPAHAEAQVLPMVRGDSAGVMIAAQF